MNVHCASLYKYLDISYLYTLHRHHQQYQTHQLHHHPHHHGRSRRSRLIHESAMCIAFPAKEEKSGETLNQAQHREATYTKK